MRALLLAAVATAASALPRPAAAEDAVVAVVSAPRSRLADELGRELSASGFRVRALSPAGPDWRAAVADLAVDPALALLGVVVSEREGRVLLFARRPRGAVNVPLALGLGPDDRLSRRRTCLRVVEELRMLAADAPAPAARASAASPPALVAPVAPPTPACAPSPAPAADLTAQAPSAPEAAAPATRPWGLGVASTLGAGSAPAEPASHVQWLWDLPRGDHLSIQARLLWPLVASQIEADGVQARLWTFAVSAGIAYAPLAPARRFRPFLAVAAGGRVLLTDSDWLGDVRQSRVVFTPSAEVAALTGARCRVAPFVDVFVELQIARDVSLVAGRLPFEQDIAGDRSLRASAGVLFER